MVVGSLMHAVQISCDKHAVRKEGYGKRSFCSGIVCEREARL